MKPRIDITGKRFGRLIATGSWNRETSGTFRWDCSCDCGAQVSVDAGKLRDGRTRSCGCLHREELSARNRVHSLAHMVPEYSLWLGMKQRCHNPKNHKFISYGGRGILVCERWKSNFKAFYDDMGTRPSPKHSLDRIDNNGNYEPGNCRWATSKEQALNTRRSITKRQREAA